MRGDPEKCLIRLFCVHLIACSHTLIQAPGTDDEEHTGDWHCTLSVKEKSAAQLNCKVWIRSNSRTGKHHPERGLIL